MYTTPDLAILTADTLYQAFFEHEEIELEHIDYSKPYKLVDADAQYFIDYVI